MNETVKQRIKDMEAKADIQFADKCNYVKVVRCKDCRCFKSHGNTGYCDKPVALLGELNPDDYCSFGERKETE